MSNNFDDAISCLRDLQRKTSDDQKKKEIEKKIRDIDSCRK
jgi:hypothetical protein